MAFFSSPQESETMVSNFAMVLERSFNPYENKDLRIPFYYTSSYREKLGVRGVATLVNPSSVSFKQDKRITRKDTQGGAVYFHWTNRLGRNNDVLEMDFSGQTSNINIKANATKPSGAVGEWATKALGWMDSVANDQNSQEGKPAVSVRSNDFSVSSAAKLSNFWNLYSLTREPLVDPKTSEPIYYYINYSSPLLGNTFVTFIGHFNRVLDFTEDAQSPFNVNYSFGFTVLASIPSMDYLYTTLTSNLQSVFMNPV
jgi:hypothetical protein